MEHRAVHTNLRIHVVIGHGFIKSDRQVIDGTGDFVPNPKGPFCGFTISSGLCRLVFIFGPPLLNYKTGTTSVEKDQAISAETTF